MPKPTKSTKAASGTPVTASKNAIASKAVVAAAKKVEANILKINTLQQKIHQAFADSSKIFTVAQVKQLMGAVSRLNSKVALLQKATHKNMKTALRNDLPVHRLVAQANSLSLLRSRLSSMALVASMSLAEGEEEVTFDEMGVLQDAPAEEVPVEVTDETTEVVSEDEVEVTDDDILSDPSISLVDDSEEVVDDLADSGLTVVEGEGEEPAEDGTDLGEDVLAEDEAEELPEGGDDFVDGLDLPDSNFDNIVSEEFLGDEAPEVLPEEGEVVAKASIKSRKLASARASKGGKSSQSDVLSAVAAEMILA